MVRLLRVVIGPAVVLATSLAAQAADLSMTPIYKARPSVASAPTWTGFQLGPTGAAATGAKRHDTALGSTASDELAKGMLFGITAGSNRQSGKLGYGIEDN